MSSSSSTISAISIYLRSMYICWKFCEGEVPINFLSCSRAKIKTTGETRRCNYLNYLPEIGGYGEDVSPLGLGECNANCNMTTEFSRIPADAERFVCCGQAKKLNIALPYWFGPLPKRWPIGFWSSGAKVRGSHMIYEWQLTRRTFLQIDKRLLATNPLAVLSFIPEDIRWQLPSHLNRLAPLLNQITWNGLESGFALRAQK